MLILHGNKNNDWQVGFTFTRQSPTSAAAPDRVDEPPLLVGRGVNGGVPHEPSVGDCHSQIVENLDTTPTVGLVLSAVG